MSQVLHKKLVQTSARKVPWWWSVQCALKRQKREIAAMFDEDERRIKLEKPLLRYMMHLKRRMDREGLPLENRSAILGKDSWPKQYKAGINRMIGIDIDWRNGLV